MHDDILRAFSETQVRRLALILGLFPTVAYTASSTVFLRNQKVNLNVQRAVSDNARRERDRETSGERRALYEWVRGWPRPALSSRRRGAGGARCQLRSAVPSARACRTRGSSPPATRCRPPLAKTRTHLFAHTEMVLHTHKETLAVKIEDEVICNFEINVATRVKV